MNPYTVDIEPLLEQLLDQLFGVLDLFDQHASVIIQDSGKKVLDHFAQTLEEVGTSAPRSDGPVTSSQLSQAARFFCKSIRDGFLMKNDAHFVEKTSELLAVLVRYSFVFWLDNLGSCVPG